MQLALTQGPQYRAARANERAASAFLTGERGRYLPRLILTGTHPAVRRQLLPQRAQRVGASRSPCRCRSGTTASARSRSRRRGSVATWPAPSARISSAPRARMSPQAFEAYVTARATAELSSTGVVVARENFRVQDVALPGGRHHDPRRARRADPAHPVRGRSGAGPLRRPAGARRPRGDPGPPTLHEQGRAVRPIRAVSRALLAAWASPRRWRDAARPIRRSAARRGWRRARRRTAGHAGRGGRRPHRYGGRRDPRHRPDRGDPVDRASTGRRGPDRRDPGARRRLRRARARRSSRWTTPSSRRRWRGPRPTATWRGSRSPARSDLLAQKASSQSELERAEATARSDEAQLDLLKVRLAAHHRARAVRRRRRPAVREPGRLRDHRHPAGSRSRPCRRSGRRSRCPSATPTSSRRGSR